MSSDTFRTLVRTIGSMNNRQLDIPVRYLRALERRHQYLLNDSPNMPEGRRSYAAAEAAALEFIFNTFSPASDRQQQRSTGNDFY